MPTQLTNQTSHGTSCRAGNGTDLGFIRISELFFTAPCFDHDTSRDLGLSVEFMK